MQTDITCFIQIALWLFAFYREYEVNRHDSLPSTFSFPRSTHSGCYNNIYNHYSIKLEFFFAYRDLPLHHKQYKFNNTFTVTIKHLLSTFSFLALLSIRPLLLAVLLSFLLCRYIPALLHNCPVSSVTCVFCAVFTLFICPCCRTTILHEFLLCVHSIPLWPVEYGPHTISFMPATDYKSGL